MPMRLAEPDRDDGGRFGAPIEGRSWAHASGWLQLSGTRHTVSCIVLSHDQAGNLELLMPFLSDTLTECGYPWEVIVLDLGSDDDTRRVLEPWADLPGFHMALMDRGTPHIVALATGLCQARGDAVVIVDAALQHSPTLIPRMILQWESGARLVFASHAAALAASHLTRCDEAELQPLLAAGEFRLPAGATELGLLDRRLLDQLKRDD